MIKNIIFDFDGVIANTFNYHLNRYQRMFPDAKLTAEELSNVHRGNFNLRNGEIWSKIDIPEYDRELGRAFVEANLVTPEFKSFFEKLHTNNFVVTSGPEGPITSALKAADILDSFGSLYGRETDHSKVIKLEMVINNFNLNKSETIFLTDTLGDVLEARKVDIECVAVDFGFHTRDILEEGNPLAICSTWEEVQEVLEKL